MPKKILLAGREANVDYIIPRDLEKPTYVVITAFNKMEEKGETTAQKIVPLSLYDTEGSLKFIEKHTNMSEAWKFHKKFVKDLKQKRAEEYKKQDERRKEG